MSLLVQIAAEFVGKKQFREAENAVQKLQSSVKKLAGAAGIGLSTAAFVNFGKKSAAAFMADEKAANRLALAIKNLGLGFETPRIERYISELSALSGITDDQLRPAMQRLLQTTGSVTKSQELLTQATDIAAGSGIDYETVVSDLSAAYVGQTRGLRKYSLGVTQAELKTMKFAEVQERLNKQFSGANAEYLTTYAGKLQLISTAAGEASEKIGGALVDSLVSVFSAGDVTKFVSQIDTLATRMADVVASVVFGFQKIYLLTSDRAILASLNPFDDYEKNALAAIEAAEKAAKLRRNQPSMGYLGSQPMNIYETPAQIAARKKAEADAAKRAKDIAALQTKQLADAKKKLALDKASKTLNLDAIGIEAALKGKISETDRISLLLQKAILEGNGTLADQLATQLDEAIKRNNELKAALLATPLAPNPYANWYPPILAPLGSGGLSLGGGSVGGGGVMPDFNVPENSYGQVGPLGGLGAGVIAGVNPTINVTVNLDGDVVAGAITELQVNESLSGTFSSINRSGFKGAVAI